MAVASPRFCAAWIRATDAQAEPVFVGEGINSSVVITERGDQRFFYVSGKSEASSALLDMRLQRMMGHLPGAGPHLPLRSAAIGAGGRDSAPA